MGQWYRTDKATGDREPVSEETVRKALEGRYYAVAAVIAVLKERHPDAILTDVDYLYDYKENRP